MGEVFEWKSRREEIAELGKEIEDKAKEVFHILKGNNIFWSGFYTFKEESSSQRTAVCWLRGEEFRIWTFPLAVITDADFPNMSIALYSNTITFDVSSESPLLPKIRDVAKQIGEKTNFKVVIHRH